MRSLVQKQIKLLAQKIIKKYNPKIIAVTGSIGKTSTKDAIYIVLKDHFNVRKSEKNYNNEFGLPLTILGFDKSPERSIIGWLQVFMKGLKLLLFKDKSYPEILVLEMGADKVGDIKYLIDIAQPDIGVLTFIGSAHLEHFKTKEKLIKEKRLVLTKLKKNGVAIVNIDNEDIQKIVKGLKNSVLTYGLSEKADVRAIELETSSSGLSIEGTKFKLVYQGSVIPVFLPKVIGKNAIMACLAGAAVGLSLGLNLVDIADSLRNYKNPKGRMNLIPGIKGSLIIDDTYNAASPEAVFSALEVLNKFQCFGNCRKIAVLGDMLELGEKEREAHKLVGKKVVEYNCDVLVTSGKLAKLIAESAKQSGMRKENIFMFDNSVEAGKFLKDFIQSNDVVLIKGAQGARMEKSVKEIMKEQDKAKDLLVRQSSNWLRN